MNLEGKRLLVGVSGGIAAYKCASMVSELRKRGAHVRVIMTESARKFVSPLTFQTVSGSPVRSDMFVDWSQDHIPHISNAEWADAFVLVPATANLIGKIANGIADDLLTTTVMAMDVPVIVAPSMNEKMFKNPVFQENLNVIREIGFHIVEPETGRLACEQVGKGRLASIDRIIERVESIFVEQDFYGCNFLISAGGTREPIDPVRFISNRSSGKTGYALAAEARNRGGKVTLVTAPTNLALPPDVEVIEVETASEMLEACEEKFDASDVIIKAAAVSDYEPVSFEDQKIKKNEDQFELLLKKTPDILLTLGQRKTRQFICGFCAETENLKASAYKKISEKELDMVVANDVSGNVFGSDYTSIIVIDSKGVESEAINLSKNKAASFILDKISELLFSSKHG